MPPDTESNDKGEKGTSSPSVVKTKTIRTVPITMRTLTENRNYTMKSREDVDKFIEEMRKKLYDRLGEDTVIKLS